MTDKMKLYKNMMLKSQDIYNRGENLQDSGFLGNLPLLVLETNYSQSNEISEHKSYYNTNFHDNMYIKPFSLNVKAILHTDLKNMLENLAEQSRERNYTYFYYSKYDALYVPIAISSFSYSESAEDSNTLKVELNLVEVNMLRLHKSSGGAITTQVFNPKVKVMRKDLYQFSPSAPLRNKYKRDKRMGGLI